MSHMEPNGTRVVCSPLHLPTQSGYLGCRRGVIVGVGETLHCGEPAQIGQYLIKLDPIGKEKSGKTVPLPYIWLVSEAAFDRWIDAGNIDPYATNPPDFSAFN